MTPEEHSLLERTYKMVEENNGMLRSIRRSSRLAIFMRILYWAVIIILSFGAYYFIQPYLTTMLNVISNAGGNIQSNYTAAQNAANAMKNLVK